MGQNILLAVPRDTLRVRLAAVFSKDPRVSQVDELRNYRELKARLYYVNERLRPDLIIVDQTLLADFSELPRGLFAILASQFDMHMLKNAYTHGACGYFLESVSTDLLLMLLGSKEHFFLIEPVLLPEILFRIFSCKTRSLAYAREELLTPREHEIVNLLRDGIDRPSIARQLCITEATLKTHIKNIARKH